MYFDSRDVRILRQEIGYSVHVICKFCVALFQKGRSDDLQALCINIEPYQNQSKNVGIYCTVAHLWAEAKPDHSQISAKYLIIFTPNCFAWALAVVRAEFRNNNAKKSTKFFHLCAILIS